MDLIMGAISCPQMASPSQALHWAQTISNTTWGHQLSFHPFSRGDAPVHFSSLWPDKEILVATYKEANLGQCVYDLCKLLLVTNSDKSLDALLEDHVSYLYFSLSLSLSLSELLNLNSCYSLLLIFAGADGEPCV